MKGNSLSIMWKTTMKPIIKREVFDLVQVELDKLEKKRQTSNIFTGRLFCGDCGSAFGSKVWHSTNKYKRTIYQCNAKYKGEHKCQTPHVTEEEIKGWFLSAINQLLSNRDEIIANTELLIDMQKTPRHLNLGLMTWSITLKPYDKTSRTWSIGMRGRLRIKNSTKSSTIP